MKSCITCGMPFEGNHANDIGLELPEGPVCKFDVEDGHLKTPQQIFEGGVSFFADAATEGNKVLAARLTRKNMSTLSYWKSHHFSELDGPLATDEEYQTAMARL